MLEDYQLRFVSADGLEIPYGDELINRLNDKLISKNAIIADERKQKELEIELKEQEIKLKEQEMQLKEQEKLRADKLEEKVKQLELLLKQAK